ncbi:UNVERIFIED_CONTAM: hypothetical protein FKN15_072619 [Acipenser sinensis]
MLGCDVCGRLGISQERHRQCGAPPQLSEVWKQLEVLERFQFESGSRTCLEPDPVRSHKLSKAWWIRILEDLQMRGCRKCP